MKSIIAIAIAALFASGTAFAQSDPPQPQKTPTQIAQAGGGASAGAGAATGAAGASLSAGTIVAIAAGVALVVSASGGSERHPVSLAVQH